MFVKRVHINSISKFYIGQGSGVGSYSRMLFSSEGVPASSQSISIGNYAGVGRNCELHVWNNNHIVIKDYSTLNDGCKLLGNVTIEKYCLLSANIFASSGNHYAFVNPTLLVKDQDNIVLNTEKGRSDHSKPIRIEEDCWIGYGVFIQRGVSIGRGAVVGANSVVLNDVEPYAVYGGVPAKEIKKRFIFQPSPFISHANDEHLPYFYRGFEHKAEILKSSRNQNCIFTGREAIAVLSPCNSFHSILLSGIKRVTEEINLIVSYQDKFQWNVTLNENTFNCCLKLENAQTFSSNVCKNLYDSLSKQMHQYSIICLEVVKPSIKNIFGIVSIKIQ